ncbi:MAG: Smr/MutS family protein [Clostridia bacterium]
MFYIGDFVKLKGSSLSGIIQRKKIDKLVIKYVVKINDKLLTIDEENIENCILKPKTVNKVNILYEMSDSLPCSEIMLRYQKYDEAMFNLEKFIDNAICMNIKTVKIIHGRHGGILRDGVQNYLTSCPYVKEFRLGNYYEGSVGVTIAKLK